MRSLLRQPLTHFVLLGAALYFAIVPWRAGDDEADEVEYAPVVVTAAEVGAMALEFEQQWGSPPSEEQKRALVARHVDEEILYRQARALALDLDDGSVRRRLLEKARAVNLNPNRGEDAVLAEVHDLGLHEDVVVRRILAQKMRLVLEGEPPPGWDDDTALQEYLERHRDRWVRPETVSFTHIFFSTDRHGPQAIVKAHAALRELVGMPPATTRPSSDPFPLGQRISGYTRDKLSGRFGEAFARSVMALEPGQWSAPLRSPYGTHLVWVEERQPQSLPPLDTVREAVRTARRAEHAARRRAQGMARLRELYDVRIESERQSAS